MSEKELPYNLITGALVDIKMWTKYVPVESGAIDQLRNLTKMPIVFKHVAAMPDVHIGIGATVGTVMATKGAVIPSAVGVDIGCGMIACRTSLKSHQLPDNLHALRTEIEAMVPVGMDEHTANRLQGAARSNTSSLIDSQFSHLEKRLAVISAKHPDIEAMVKNSAEKSWRQLGSLGGGNHFLEIAIAAEDDSVWLMLHSGSRGIGNAIGRYFIELAKKEMEVHKIQLPDRDLAYLQEGSIHYHDYLEAVSWAQEYASRNREVMMNLMLTAMARHLPSFTLVEKAISCHHNYINKEKHFGEDVIITRKGAVSAQLGQLGIIPGSMGAKSFIVKGLGNQESFCSCSHGAGRVMSRSAAKKLISLDDHAKATAGVECRKDEGMIDESPAAYKDIIAVMKSQEDLVEIVYTLKQVLCVKG